MAVLTITVAGLAFDATVLPIKVLYPKNPNNPQGDHEGNVADIAQGIMYAANHGAQVINMSLAAQSACGQTYIDAIAYARQLGVNVVVAAGNDAVASTGGGFGPFYAKWIQGHGTGSGRQIVADFTGDQKADAMVYFDTNPNSWCFAGSWYGAASDGAQFGPYYSPWISGHGRGSTQQLAGDVDGNGRADAVVYFADIGAWYVAHSLHP